MKLPAIVFNAALRFYSRCEMKRYLTLFAILSLSNVASALTVIETQSLWSGASFNNVSNGPVTVQLGQTFTVPLVGDSVFDQGYLNFNSTLGRNFTMNLGAVSGNTVTSILATQSETLLGNGTWENIQFNPADVPLVPGGTYAIWASMPLSPTNVMIQSFNSSVYAGGVYFTSLATMPGNVQTFAQNDASFRVELIAPEPASLSSLAGGLLCAARRRRQSR